MSVSYRIESLYHRMWWYQQPWEVSFVLGPGRSRGTKVLVFHSIGLPYVVISAAPVDQNDNPAGEAVIIEQQHLVGLNCSMC